MSLACIVFDCDGVILDSVPTKTRAFARLAEPYGAEARDRFVMYHMTHGGVSRYRKFAWFFSEILGREITPQESEEWGKRFASYSLEEVKRCPLIPGVEKALTDWEGKLPMCVCSGSPTEELRSNSRPAQAFALLPAYSWVSACQSPGPRQYRQGTEA